MTIQQVVQLRDDIRWCTNCDLREKALCPVPWSGPTPSKYLFIGMAPGIEEDKRGAPFVGSSGNKLKYWLKQAGFPSDVAYANAVSCFPGRVKGGDAKPTIQQLQACRSNLTRQIDIIEPKYIFLVGGTALEAFRPDLTLSYTHGRPLYYDGVDMNHKLTHTSGIVVWTIYHPAAALRSRKYEKLIIEDLATFWAWRRLGEPWPDLCYVCSKEVEEFDRWGFPYCSLHLMKQQKLFQ